MMESLDSAVFAAMRDACERAILPRYQTLAASEVMEKAADDFVTIADKESEAILTEALGRLLPEAAIVGEEAAHDDPSVLDRLRTGLCWIIDPIDGTWNFAHGKPPFGVLIALADGGETIGGWLYDPLKNRFCHARRDGGAFLNDEPIRARGSGEDVPVAAVSLLFIPPHEREGMRRAIAPAFRMVDIPRCAEEQYPRIALGENDASFFERTLPWDHAAGVLWLNEAGGKAARPDGGAYQPGAWDQPGLIAASTPELWEHFARLLEAR
jgi:fructose-1,6-bisphosphatase/inositol monophosphatase family enzyme